MAPLLLLAGCVTMGDPNPADFGICHVYLTGLVLGCNHIEEHAVEICKYALYYCSCHLEPI